MADIGNKLVTLYSILQIEKKEAGTSKVGVGTRS